MPAPRHLVVIGGTSGLGRAAGARRRSGRGAGAAHPASSDGRVARVDLETVDLLLTTTRAVRKRLDLPRPVPAELIIECVRIAPRARGAADMQNWRWVVLTDP